MVRKNPISITIKLLIFMILLLTVTTWKLCPESDPELHLFDPAFLELPSMPLLGDSQPLDLSYDFAQLNESSINGRYERMDFNKKYWKGFWFDFKKTYTSPFRWKGSDWLKAGLIVGVTLVQYRNDDGMAKWIEENSSSTTDKISNFAEMFGNYGTVVPLLAAIYSYGGLFKNAKARETAVLAAKSIAISFIAVYGLKLLGHRRRPNAGRSTQWDGPGLSFSDSSFPSGHSAMAFSLAVVLSHQYKSPLIRVTAYTTAFLTALSRIHDRKHWASDVFFGSMLGYLITRGIVKRKKKAEKDLGKNVQIFPLISFHQVGLSLNIGF
jgi:membrane-associated phospholipid phosphatase